MNNACCRPVDVLASASHRPPLGAIVQASVAALVLTLAACSSASKTCMINGDCPSGQSCISQQCVATPKSTTCTTNSDCSNGQTCVASACVSADGGTPASSCTSDSQCSGATPFCLTGGNTCVACNTATDCSDSLKTCTDNACVLPAGTCEADSDCSGTTPVCDTTTNLCVGCVSSGDCATGLLCSSVTNSCVQCIQNSDCATGLCMTGVCTSSCTTDGDCAGNPAGAYCSTTAGVCVACNTNSECSTGQVCTNNACVTAPTGCSTNSDCTGNAAGTVCNTTTSMCVQCLQSSDCSGNAAGSVCNTASDSCVQCLQNSDCAGNAAGTVCNTSANTCTMGTTVMDGGTGGTDAGTPPVMDGGTGGTDAGTPPVMDGGTTVLDGGTGTPNAPIGGLCTDLEDPPVQANCATGLVCENVEGVGMCSKACTENNACGKNGTEANYCPGIGFCFASCSATVPCPSSELYCDEPSGSCLPACPYVPCTYGETCQASGACAGTTCTGGHANPTRDTCPSGDVCYEESDSSLVCVADCTATSCPTGMACGANGSCNDYYAGCGTAETAYQCQGSTGCILPSATATTGVCLATCVPSLDGADCPADQGASDCVAIGSGTDTEYFCALSCGPGTGTTCPSGTTCQDFDCLP